MAIQGKLLADLLGFTIQGANKWKREERPVVALLEQFFSDSDISEFLETGNIKRISQDNNTLQEVNLYKKLLADHALYSAKEKLQKLLDGNFIDRAIYTKGAKGILVDVLEQINPNDGSYTIENAKQRLLDAVMGSEVSWLSLKNPQKQKLLSSILNKHLSSIEAYAIIKNPKEVLDY